MDKEEDSDGELVISTLSTECNSVDRKSNSDIIWITPCVNGKLFQMELDTGSAVSVISKQDYTTHFGNKQLKNTNITTLVFEVKFEHEGQTAMLKLYVVEKGSPALFGRDWLQKIQLNWKNIKCLHNVSSGFQRLRVVKIWIRF